MGGAAPPGPVEAMVQKDSRVPGNAAASRSDPDGSRAARRRTFRALLVVAVLGFAVHLLLPQVAELEQGLQALRSGRWPYLIVVLVGAILVFVASAWMVHASVPSPPSWGRTLLVQVAAGFASTVTPVGLGWFTVTQASLQQAGTDAAEARAATGLNLVLPWWPTPCSSLCCCRSFRCSICRRSPHRPVEWRSTSP